MNAMQYSFNLKKNFRLHKEREAQLTNKLREVKAETASEYLMQLEVLQQQKKIKLEVSTFQSSLTIFFNSFDKTYNV